MALDEFKFLIARREYFTIIKCGVRCQYIQYSVIAKIKRQKCRNKPINCRLVTDIQQSKLRVSITIGVSLQPSILSVYMDIAATDIGWLICVQLFVLLIVNTISFLETTRKNSRNEKKKNKTLK